MKILFMGTPTFAVGILEALGKEHEIVGVITQPDHLGKKGALISSPVASFARAQGYPLYQPKRIKDDCAKLLTLSCDFIVTAAYGQIVPNELLALPKYLPLNVHGSLLPRWRGGAPIQRAIMAGDEKTGITFMVMAHAMDAGDIIELLPLPLLGTESADDVFASLSLLASARINALLARIARGDYTRTTQDSSLVTFAHIIRKEEEALSFKSESAEDCARRIRALWSDPGARFTYNQQLIKVVKARALNGLSTVEAGQFEGRDKTGFIVSCAGKTRLLIEEIRPAGKNTMSAASWLNGVRNLQKGIEIL